MRVLLVAYNAGNFINYFPLNLAYLAAVLRQDNHEVSIYQQDVYHYPESHLTSYLDKEHFDIVGVGACAGYWQYRKLSAIVEAVKESEYCPPIIVGGHMVSGAPQYFMDKFKATIFVGEGERSLIKYLQGFIGIPSIVESKPIEQLDSIPMPALDLFPINYYSLIRLPHAEKSDRCFPVLSGRGCPFHCNFCFRLEEGYRPHSVARIVDEVQRLIKDYGITYIDFADELLMVSSERIRKLSEALKPFNIKWMCNGRLNLASLEHLRAMKEAGCVFINYGIESVDDTVLRNMNKALTVQQITKGVKETLEVGISPGLNMLWGNLGDTKETLWKAVSFLLKYSDTSQMRTIRPVTPYPGCELYQEALRRGLVKDAEDFYEHKHVNSDLLTVNFTNLTDEAFYKELYQANKALLKKHYSIVLEGLLDEAQKLYYEKDISFRGFRQI